MKTGFWCEYELKDTTARQDSTLTTTSNQDFGNITRGKDDIVSADYATLEEDYFLLDGSLPEMPDIPPDVVYFSRQLSRADGTFAENPVIVIAFTEKHTSYGLTFCFVGDWPLEMEIRWYDLTGTLMSQKTYVITGNKFFAQNQVENYGRLEIEFTKTKPYRYVKFRYIEYGTDLIFGTGGLSVKDAKLIEETDPISDKIAINKLSYKVIDEADEFNTGNWAGMHKVLQPAQKLVAWENVSGAPFLLGKYFLDTSSTESNVTNMSCVDYKGLLDKNNFRAGRVYNGEPAGLVIDEIMTAAGIMEYTVTDEVREIPLYGWLKIQTCRKALREVLFATGAVVDSSRSLTLNIYLQNRKIQSVVKRTRKFSTSVNTEDYISDVSVKFPVYTLANETKQVAKGSYEAAGTYTIDLSSPAVDMTINTGTIIEQSCNYVTFKLMAPAEVIITGKKYEKEDLTVTASVPKVEAGQSRNSKSFTCTVLDAGRAGIIAGKLLDYYALRLGIQAKFLNEGDCTGTWAEIYNTSRLYGNYAAGIEKMTTDLTGGFISTAELRGYYRLLTDYDYTGEIFTGDETGEL